MILFGNSSDFRYAITLFFWWMMVSNVLFKLPNVLFHNYNTAQLCIYIYLTTMAYTCYTNRTIKPLINYVMFFMVVILTSLPLYVTVLFVPCQSHRKLWPKLKLLMSASQSKWLQFYQIFTVIIEPCRYLTIKSVISKALFGEEDYIFLRTKKRYTTALYIVSEFLINIQNIQKFNDNNEAHLLTLNII